MRAKKKKTIFICQVTEDSLKVIKCLLGHDSKRQFVGLEVETIPSDTDDKKLAERLNQVFKKIEYNRNPVIISLPCGNVTSRYLKIPTQVPKEIEKIIALQAPRYLPYPADELINGYQLIKTDKEGYSDINLIIVHKDIIERYFNIFKELKVTEIKISLSSYGLCNLYNYTNPEETGAVMVIDIDTYQVELAIIFQKRLLFSRSFKFIKGQANWKDLFTDEINKTQDAYLKEVSKEPLSKIVIVGNRKVSPEFVENLSRQTNLPVEVFSYTDKIDLSNNVLNSILNSDNSFASLIGLGLKDLAESLNLLPQDIKEGTKSLSQRKERLRLILFIFGITLIWGLGIAKNLDNKAKYLKRLKIELNKIAKEANPLEKMERRLRLLESHSKKKPSSLEILYELHQIIPASISLVNLTYEEANQIILRGQTQELNFVFEFVSQIEKSAVFKNFNVKVSYATKKKTQVGEILDFEIVCSRQ